MPDPHRPKQVTFTVLTGIVLTIFNIGTNIALNYFEVEHFAIWYGTVYAVEFGVYCLALYLYLNAVSRILWFSQGFVMLILATLLKIVLSVLLSFFILTLAGRNLDAPGYFLLALFGPHVRGFVIEIGLMAIAARIFETDIFQKENNRDNRVIDNQLH